MTEANPNHEIRNPKSEPANSRAKPFDPHLHSRFREWVKERGMGNRQLANQMAVSETKISKYLNGKPEGDIKGLEGIVADFMRNNELHIDTSIVLCQTAVALEVESVIETIIKTNDVGAITGPAGIGKTCGCMMFAQAHPLAAMVTARRRLNNDEAQVRLIWDQIDTGAYPQFNGQSHVQFLERRYKGSNRPIIVDNCHRLGTSALQFYFDFNDETGAPIILSGNPEFIKNIRKNDQMYSRIGLHHPLKLREPKEFAEAILSQFAPDHASELRKVAQQVVSATGHGRALRKQLLLTRELMRGGIDDPLKAFKSAHTKLIGRDYVLED